MAAGPPPSKLTVPSIRINDGPPDELPRAMAFVVSATMDPPVDASALSGTLTDGTAADQLANTAVAVSGDQANFTFFIPLSYPFGVSTAGRLYVLTVYLTDGGSTANDAWPQRPVAS